MSENSIYGAYEMVLPEVMEDVVSRIRAYQEKEKENTGDKIFEHLAYRIKSEESMREKCRRRNLPQTPHSALRELKDAIGLRIVCDFVDDIYKNVSYIKGFHGARVVEEKDYIRQAKPNGYRSYHMILEVLYPHADVDGKMPGRYYVEIQLRTIAMDTWAALEHEMKYKQNIKNPHLMETELKRCADELASCDLSLQTIRNLIRESGQEET